MSSVPISIGVLYFPVYQLLDAAGPTDYLNNHTKAYLSLVGTPLAHGAPEIIWHHISPTPTLSPISPSSGPNQIPTCTYDTCPPLDYLLVPGPDVMVQLPEGCSEFIKKIFPGLKGLLLVCTGSIAISKTGVLDGFRVCSNKFVLRTLLETGQLRKEVKWMGDRRWIKDGKVWSAAGVTAGIDLAAEFARVHFDPAIVEFVKNISEYSPNPDQPDSFKSILKDTELWKED